MAKRVTKSTLARVKERKKVAKVKSSLVEPEHKPIAKGDPRAWDHDLAMSVEADQLAEKFKEQADEQAEELARERSAAQTRMWLGLGLLVFLVGYCAIVIAGVLK